MAHRRKTQKRGHAPESTIPSADRESPRHTYRNWPPGQRRTALPARPDRWCARGRESWDRLNRRTVSRPPCAPAGVRHRACAATSDNGAEVAVAVAIEMRLPVFHPEELQRQVLVLPELIVNRREIRRYSLQWRC